MTILENERFFLISKNVYTICKNDIILVIDK
jgi:hypothetical protein